MGYSWDATLCKQVEPDAEHDIWQTYLSYRPVLTLQLTSTTGVSGPAPTTLQHNPIYSTTMARLKYRRAPGKLPPHDDHWAMSTYAKNHYNTNQGKATPEKYYEDYRRLVLA